MAEPTPTLTSRLASIDPPAFSRATQAPFLLAAALGKLPKDILGTWLANDRLYIHGYIKGVGRLLDLLDLPLEAPKPNVAADPLTIRLLDWLVGALVNIRREERFFLDVAATYGIEINLHGAKDGRIGDAAKLEGLRLYEHLFGSVKPGVGDLPWLEAAVLFYASEKAYLEAWTWAKNQLVDQDASKDVDGGALRKEFIPNWTSEEFVSFVNELGDIIDEAVAEQAAQFGPQRTQELFDRASKVWTEVIAAEELFWPKMTLDAVAGANLS